MGRILDGLRDAIAGRFTKVTRVAVNGKPARPMTPAEEAAFDKAFGQMSKAFDGLSEAVDEVAKTKKDRP